MHLFKSDCILSNVTLITKIKLCSVNRIDLLFLSACLVCKV